ncbi:MAG: hypothetical protein U0414_14950 [Polyangiaceae bacterium]
MKVRGFAELVFSDSARLAFISALERAQTDIDQQAPDAWLIDERRIRFAFEGDIPLGSLDAYRRLLEQLIELAEGGEANLALESGETWARHVGDSASHALGDEDRFPTLRTAG